MNGWDWAWIGWLAFMAGADFVASHYPGQTFTEHVREWMKGPKGAVVLGIFFGVLYLHFVVDWPVWPIVLSGLVVAHFIRRYYHMFRWDKAAEGAVWSGLLSALTVAPLYLKDGQLTGVETVMLIGEFLGGIVLYIRTHKEEWNGEERRMSDAPPGK